MPPSTTGVIVIAHGQWFAEIAGLPLLPRVLLGSKAGVRRWIVLVQHEVQWVRSSLATAYKLRDIAWQVHDLHATEPGRLAAAFPAEDVLVVMVPAVFDYRLLTDLQGALLRRSASPRLLHSLRQISSSMTVGSSLVLYKVLLLTVAPDPALLWHAVGPGARPDVARDLPVTFSTHGPPDQAARPDHCPGTRCQPASVALDYGTTGYQCCDGRGATTPELGREDDSMLVRMLDRRLSPVLTKRLMRTSATPNQITLASAAVGIMGPFCLAQPSQVWQVLGSLLFLLSTILDGCDGEIARLTFQESAFGAKLDLIMDNVVPSCSSRALHWVCTVGSTIRSILRLVGSLWVVSWSP